MTASLTPDADLRSLSRQRRMTTAELHVQNAFYGHDTLLKRHGQVSMNRSLKVAIEHGPALDGNWFWRIDLGTPMPTFLCGNSARARQYRDVGGRASESRAIGPLILYARPSAERPPGDRLLFFPPHSSQHVPAVYDMRAVAEKLERYRRDWNQISVCIYWRDVLDGWADLYSSFGVECVTAGHVHDPAFLDRLRAIIERCDAVTSIEIGSHIFYSLALNRPVRLERQAVDYTRESPPGLVGTRTAGYHNDMKRLGRVLEGEPTRVDLDWIGELAGIEEHKTAFEMREILEEAEERYQDTYRLHERFLHLARARTPEPVRRVGSPLYWRLRKI